LSVGGGEATALEQGKQPAAAPQDSADNFGELRVWSDGGRIYLAEPGANAREVDLGDGAEAHRLGELLQQHGATDSGASVRLDRMLLAGGGGDGFHWAPPGRKPNSTAPAASPAAHAVTGQPPILPTMTRSPQPSAPVGAAQARTSSKD
jgi:hypothetical protein